MRSVEVKTIVKAVVVDTQGYVLVMQRSLRDPKGPGLWDLPGGTVDDGESVETAMIRELAEEAGIHATSRDIRLRFTKTGSFEQGDRCWLFYVLQYTERPDVVISHEHEMFEWISLKQACERSFFQAQEDALRYITTV